MVCYPFEIFLNIDMLSEIQCPVCDGVVKDGFSDACGKSIGLECYNQLIENEAACPGCKKPASLNQIMQLPSNLSKFISRLQVKCINNECTWTGRLEEYEIHLKSNCSFEDIRCLFDGCEIAGQRRTVIRHQMTCPQKPVTCEMCTLKVTLQNLDKHQELLCPEMMIGCTMHCGQRIKRHQMEQHLTYVCPETLSECEFKQLGCTFVGKRKDAVEHALSNRGYSHHMLLLMECFKGWQAEDQGTFKRIESQLNKIENCLTKNQSETEKLSNLLINLQTTLHSTNAQLKNLMTPLETNRSNNQNSSNKNKLVIPQENLTQAMNLNPVSGNSTNNANSFSQQTGHFTDARNLYAFDSSKLDQGLGKNSTSVNLVAPSNSEKPNVQPGPLVLPAPKVEPAPHSFGGSYKEQPHVSQTKPEPRFDDKACTDSIKAISSKQVLNVKGKGIILMRDAMISGHSYKINSTGVKSTEYAIGVCIKSALAARKYSIDSSMDDCFLFLNSGNQVVDGMIVKMGQSQPGFTFTSGCILEMSLDSKTKKLSCTNRQTGGTGCISLSDLESLNDLYPCIVLGEKMETAQID